MSSKTKVEAAITKIGKAYAELLRAFEAPESDPITREEAYKVFEFLKQGVLAVEKKAFVALDASNFTSGAFSWDMDIPPAAMRQERTPTRKPQTVNEDDGVDFLDEEDD